MATDTDAELVKRVQNGDQQAFDMLYQRHVHKIRALARNFVDTHEDAEDIAQETFIKAFRALPRFRAQSAFYTWLYRIATNTAKNFLASRSRRPQSSEMDLLDESKTADVEGLVERSGPEDLLYGDELNDVVMRALSDLPSELRTALTFREFSGLSYEEIAEIMQCPVGTVRSRIFRAREAIDRRVRGAS